MEHSKVVKALTDVILFFSTVFWQLFGAQQNATKTGTVALGQFLIYPTSQIILTIFEYLQIQIFGKFVAMTSVDKNDVVVSKMLIKDVHGPLFMWLPEGSGTRSGHGPSFWSRLIIPVYSNWPSLFSDLDLKRNLQFFWFILIRIHIILARSRHIVVPPLI